METSKGLSILFLGTILILCPSLAGFGCVFRKECSSFTQGGRCTMLSPAFLVISASLRAANCSECLLQRCSRKGLDLTLGTTRRRSSLPSRNLVPQASKEAQHARFAARVPSKRRHSGRWRLRCSFCSPRTAQGEFVCHRKLLASGYQPSVCIISSCHDRIHLVRRASKHAKPPSAASFHIANCYYSSGLHL